MGLKSGLSYELAGSNTLSGSVRLKGISIGGVFGVLVGVMEESVS